MNPELSRKKEITAHIPAIIEHNIPLHDKNWFMTGGNARYFCQPETREQFQEAVQWAAVQNMSIFLLGEGANILVSDDGFDGLVIRSQLKNVEIINHSNEEVYIKAGSGVSFSHLIEFCLEHQLGGLEEFSGIPGSVGGSVFINIHYFEFLLDAFITEATIIHAQTGTIETVDHAWFNFGYNYSTLHRQDHFVTDVTFKLKKLTTEESWYAKGRRIEMMRHRARRYPISRTCGSFFRNFYENEVTLESNGKKLIYVAYYLDKLGFKGQLSVGDALVSHLHANMIVNKKTASSQDIISLARTMQEAVHTKFGIMPQPECRLIGFKSYPLL